MWLMLAELHNLVGDAAGARERLGWEPTVSFEELVRLLVDADLEQLRSAAVPGVPANTMGRQDA
jgi:GDPmannose 4,6-dehydratase